MLVFCDSAQDGACATTRMRFFKKEELKNVVLPKSVLAFSFTRRSGVLLSASGDRMYFVSSFVLR